MPIGWATTINTTPVQRPVFQDNTQPTVKGMRMGNDNNNNDNDRLTAFDPGQPG